MELQCFSFIFHLLSLSLSTSYTASLCLYRVLYLALELGTNVIYLVVLPSVSSLSKQLARYSRFIHTVFVISMYTQTLR